jgi:hypothetical protein
MNALKCRRYAEQCLQLAQRLGPRHRTLLLEWAHEWRKVAQELAGLEEQDAPEDQFGTKQKNGN